MNLRNIFLYWIGKEYNLILILRDLIYLHSKSGKGYNIILITEKNINEYITNIPDYFYKLCPAHQADFVRVNVICDYGGIWLDSDIIVMQELDSLFDLIDNQNGFFIKENNEVLWNGVFGSKKNTQLMQNWKNNLINILDKKKQNIKWCELGSNILENINKLNPEFYINYKIFNGLDNMYPVNWNNCIEEFINKPYENYNNIIREFQPIVVLVNSVYKNLENKTITEITEGDNSIRYFINKSLENFNIKKQKIYSDENNDTNINKEIFENIYKNKIWNNGNDEIPLSGPGSSLINTKNCSELLDNFIYLNNCETILDLGCGDLTWISKTKFFNDNNIEYTGIDIVENLINIHTKKYFNKKFYCYDITQLNININFNSLIIIRDVLFHLYNDQILKIFNNIKNKFNFIVITSCKNTVNNDNFNEYYFSEKNINIEPFNISQNYLIKLEENKFNRHVYIYSHNEFYSR